jgi:ATP-dependent DNA helicase RecQ
MAQEVLQDPGKVLQTVFGYSRFRPLQEEAIECILGGGDALVILPTGGGKSLCYQIPAVILPGITVVISPLIALMKDQVEALRANGISAVALNSAMDDRDRREVYADVEAGRIKLLYVSPEKALSPGFGGWLARLPIALLAVDEAHCVSMWGNDFRPEYARLAGLFEQLPRVPVLALTATADPATREDIADKLRLRDPLRLLGSFERTNLFLEVQPAQQRFPHIRRFIASRTGQAGIIYCLARSTTENLATRLNEAGIRAAAYHAKLERHERDRVQEAFQKDLLQVVCATIAFGMGIDKSNIRWIIHYNLPKNVESYYQEIGRAGRDGLPADTLLFAGFGDVMSYRGMIEESEAGPEFKALQIAKLDRMFDFAQAHTCRTNFILGYFGESRGEPCGHCDLCRNPPRAIDGTVLAQQALSALRRTGEQVGIQLLVDILRGSNLAEIRQAGYDRIRTFGIGKDISRNHWLHYVTQLINLGILAIDYTAHSKLRISPLGEEVLFQGRTVSLVQPVDLSERKSKARERAKAVSPQELFREELLEALRQWRVREATKEGLAPTHLLSDFTLSELVEKKVLFQGQLAGVSGFSEHRIARYGQAVLDVIRNYALSQQHVRTIRGSTYLETLMALREGLPPRQAAAQRQRSLSTIYAHILWLYEQDEPLDMAGYIPMDKVPDWHARWKKAGKPETLTHLMEQLPSDTDYNQVRLALTWYEKEGKPGT